MMANSGLSCTHSMITNIILVVKIQRQKKKEPFSITKSNSEVTLTGGITHYFYWGNNSL